MRNPFDAHEPIPSRNAPPPSDPALRIATFARRPDLPLVISITGASSNTGKTQLMERAIRHFRKRQWPVTALKVTRTHIGSCPRKNDACTTCDDLVHPFELVENILQLDVNGKDTGRYLAAGADQVLWLLVQPTQVGRGVARALDKVSPGHVLLVEGNSFRDWADAHQTFMAVGRRLRVKPSARMILDRVDAFVAEAATQAHLKPWLADLGLEARRILTAGDLEATFEDLLPHRSRPHPEKKPGPV
ncbi:MAG TPA: hypothetical protein ENK43_12925 [Planctomycetes bacterium]|nr:hypothetical protein [Planctomycetota bacterium]